MKLNILIFVALLTVLISCKLQNSKEYLVLNAGWFIDSISANGKDVKYLLTGNLMMFEDDHCSIPTLQIGMNKGDNISSWEVNEDTNEITIRSKNQYFDKTFSFCFKKHKEDNVIELYMESDSISILAHSPNKIESGLLEPPFLCEDR